MANVICKYCKPDKLIPEKEYVRHMMEKHTKIFNDSIVCSISIGRNGLSIKNHKKW